jgi:ABC-type phosphate transport system substrate-binding protein
LNWYASHPSLGKVLIMPIATFSFNFSFFPVASPRANASNQVWLPGATGTSALELVTAWSSAFHALYPEADVTLSGIGSLAAQKALYGEALSCFDPDQTVEAICERGTVEETLWGMGDLPLQPFEERSHQETPHRVQQLPAVASAVSIVYSKDVTRDKLHMTFEILSGIFNSTILYWDDPRLLQLNPLAHLPHEPIRKLVRQDESGQTALFTEALAARVPTRTWPLQGPLADPNQFSYQDYCLDSDNTTYRINDISHFAVKGTHGMVQSLLRIPYSIGYMDLGSYHSFSDVLEQVQLETNGTFVPATMDSLSITVGNLIDQLQPESLQLDLTQPPTPPGGYPIAGYAYWYFKTSPDAYTDCYQAWLLCKFLEWSYLDSQATQLALAHGWLVPPIDIVNQTLAKLQEVQCYDTELIPPAVVQALSYVPPPYRIQEPDTNKDTIMWISIVAGLAATNVLILLVWCYDRRRLLQELQQQQPNPQETSIKVMSIKPIIFTEEKSSRNEPEEDPLVEETQNPSQSFDEDESYSETSISQLTMSEHLDDTSSNRELYAAIQEKRGFLYQAWSRLNEEVKDEISV